MKFAALVLTLATVSAVRKSMTPGQDINFDAHFGGLEANTQARQAADIADHNKQQSTQTKDDAWRGKKPWVFAP